MDMKPTGEVRFEFDLSEWTFLDGHSEIEKAIEPCLAKACASAIQNSLTDFPPDLWLTVSDDTENDLFFSLMLSALGENVGWRCSLSDLILEAEVAGENRKAIADALRAIAQRVDENEIRRSSP